MNTLITLLALAAFVGICWLWSSGIEPLDGDNQGWMDWDKNNDNV